jgi:hypothetical protein
MMCLGTDNPTSCEICGAHEENKSAVEIHCELCMVYGQNVMSEGTMFEDERTNVHDEE